MTSCMDLDSFNGFAILWGILQFAMFFCIFYIAEGYHQIVGLIGWTWAITHGVLIRRKAYKLKD